MIRSIAILLLALVPAFASAEFRRSDAEYPISSPEVVEYQGDDYDALASRIHSILKEFRDSLGGATFGIDASSKEPVEFEGAKEEAVLDMLRKTPALAEEVRQKGGLLSAVFEFRPAMQPANANVYLRAEYSAMARRFTLTRLTDPATAPEREDITGMNVDMAGSATP